MLRLKTKREAMVLLKKDHDAVRRLFERFDKVETGIERKEIVREACAELKVHAAVEEELFYPALRQKMEDGDGLLDRADEEHHEVKILVAELELMSGDEDNFRAKFTLLAERARLHFKEEELKIFPKARRTVIDFDALGERIHARRLDLITEGVPPGPEAEMIGKFGLPRESPSRRAQKTLTPPIRRGRKH